MILAIRILLIILIIVFAWGAICEKDFKQKVLFSVLFVVLILLLIASVVFLH